MKLRDLIQKLMDAALTLDDEVKVDASCPLDFEKIYDVERGKGWILLTKPKEGK